MTKKILAYVIVLVILAGAGYALYQMRGGSAPVSKEEVRLDIAQYSVEGKVVSVGEDSVVISTGKVELTEEGNKFVTYERTIRFAGTVKFTEKGKQTEISAGNLLSSLKAQDRAVFYGTVTGDFPKEGELLASRVDILNRATTGQ